MSASSARLRSSRHRIFDFGAAEIFRDEAVDYASRIWQAGGSAELHVWPGAFHGFDLATHTRIAQDASTAPDRWLRRILAV